MREKRKNYIRKWYCLLGKVIFLFCYLFLSESDIKIDGRGFGNTLLNREIWEKWYWRWIWVFVFIKKWYVLGWWWGSLFLLEDDLCVFSFLYFVLYLYQKVISLGERGKWYENDIEGLRGFSGESILFALRSFLFG